MSQVLYLVRHCQATGQEPDAPLTELGQQHGNLMTLMLKHFNEQVGYAEWENLRNPDVYCIQFSGEGTCTERMIKVSMPVIELRGLLNQ
jgi:hypothetical protein